MTVAAMIDPPKRRRRTSDGLGKLAQRAKLSPAQVAAAQCLRAAIDEAADARDNRNNRSLRVKAPTALHLTEIGSAVSRACGDDALNLLRHVVIAGGNVRDSGLRIGPPRATRLLGEALDVVARELAKASA